MATLKIALLCQDNIAEIVNAFLGIGWNKPVSLYNTYLEEQQTGQRLMWVAWQEGVFAGYICLVWLSSYSHFKHNNMPEICDLNVLPIFRKRGIGSALLKQAEKEASKRSNAVGIGVGLTNDYMTAFKLYLNLSYVLTEVGICSKGRQAKYGDSVLVDDDLCLTLQKKICD